MNKTSLRYPGLIFDLDGTLLNTLADLTLAGNYALKQQNFPTHSQSAFQAAIGHGLKRLILDLAPTNLTPEIAEELVTTFKDRYQTHYQVKTKPYPGIEPLLKQLISAGYRLAVLSNKQDNLTKALIEHHFAGYFEVIYGEIDQANRKPNPAGVYRIASDLKLSLAELMLIGDSEIDLLTAKQANIAALGVTWGFRPKTELANYPYPLIDQPNELLKHLF